MDASQRQTETSLFGKWGAEIVHFGWTAIPNALLRNMGVLGISPTEMVIICHLNRFWWEKDRLPFPSILKMADEMGVSSKTIERNLSSLEKKGLIIKIERSGKSNSYDMTPLVEKLRLAIVNDETS
jgi:biotin operon repressor